MTRRRVLLVSAFLVGSCLVLLLVFVIRGTGGFGAAHFTSRNEPPRARTRFADQYSLASAARDILPGVQVEELCAARDETYLFDSDSRRVGAIIRTHAIRNEAGHPVNPELQHALHLRLLEGMAGEIRSENAEVFFEGVTQSNWTNFHPPLNIPDADPDRPMKTGPQRFVRGKIAYRAQGIEGRVFTLLSGEGPAMMVTVTIVEQPSDLRAQ